MVSSLNATTNSKRDNTKRGEVSTFFDDDIDFFFFFFLKITLIYYYLFINSLIHR